MAVEDDEEEEEQEEDEAVEGLRGGSGGGGDEGVSPGIGAGLEDRINGDELCETNERLRAGNGGGTSHPKLSQPPPSTAPGGRWDIRLPLPLLPERPTDTPLGKCADWGRWAGDGER